MSIVNMLSPFDGDGDRAMVPMCERHQDEAYRKGWVELNPDHFLAGHGIESCERCDAGPPHAAAADGDDPWRTG